MLAGALLAVTTWTRAVPICPTSLGTPSALHQLFRGNLEITEGPMQFLPTTFAEVHCHSVTTDAPSQGYSPCTAAYLDFWIVSTIDVHIRQPGRGLPEYEQRFWCPPWSGCRQGRTSRRRSTAQQWAKADKVFDKLAAYGPLLVVVDQPATIGALPVAVARASGHQVAYLPGLASRSPTATCWPATRTSSSSRPKTTFGSTSSAAPTTGPRHGPIPQRHFGSTPTSASTTSIRHKHTC